MMSDSVFSLIILVYVSVTFCIVFFLFCWKATNGRNGQLDFKQQCPLMTNEIRVRIKGLAAVALVCLENLITMLIVTGF